MNTEPNVQPQETQPQQPAEAQSAQAPSEPMKFCKHCGAQIPADAVICTHCGRQVEAVGGGATPNIVINNTNTNQNTNVNALNAYVAKKARNKWVAFLLCLFLGFFGAHKFYEGKVGMGILYLFTGGLFAIGWFVDLIALLLKPNPYFV